MPPPVVVVLLVVVQPDVSGTARLLADAARTASTLPPITRGRTSPDKRFAVVPASICVLSLESGLPALSTPTPEQPGQCNQEPTCPQIRALTHLD